MGFEQALMLGMAEDRLERADAATRHAGATGCLSATPSRPGLCSLAVLYVGLHLPADRICRLLDVLVPDKGAGLCADPASTQPERQGFVGAVFPAEIVPAPAPFKIP